MAAGKIFANSLERRRQKFHIVCLLLWLRDTSSKFTNSKVCWLDSTSSTGARWTDGRDVWNQEGAWIQVLPMPTLLLIRILKVFTPQHVDYCHPRISGAPGRLHQLLLHLCDSCCTGCLKDICILFGRLI